MKTIIAPILSVKTRNTINGKPIIVEKTIKGAKEQIEQAIVNCAYGEFWLPSDLVSESHNEIVLTLHEVGDTFVAAAPSSRTKGEVMGKDCPEGLEDEPLYLKGDVVPRTKEHYEAQLTQAKKEQSLGFEEKAKILMRLGVNPASLMG
jgi:hypothetical protein